MPTSAGLQNEAIDLTFKEVRVNANKMVGHYETARKDVQKRLKNLYKLMDDSNIHPDDYATYMLESNRLKVLNQQIDEIYTAYSKQAGLEIERASRLALSNQYYRNQYSLSWFTPMATPSVDYAFSLIDPVAVEMSVYSTTSSFNALKDQNRKNKLKGILPKGISIDQHGKEVLKGRPTLGNILYRNKTKELKKIKNTITQGFIQGKSFSQMEMSVRHVFNGSKNNGLRVMRTETIRNSNVADFLTNQDTKELGLDSQRQWTAVLDSRTRSQSASMDGQMEDPNGLFHYPNGATSQYPGGSGVAAYDINERCTTIVVMNGVGPLIRRGRNPATGKNEVAEMSSFGKWAKKHNLTKNKYGEIVQDTAKIKAKKEVLEDSGLFATDVATASEIQQELIDSGIINPESADFNQLYEYTTNRYIDINNYLRTGATPTRGVTAETPEFLLEALAEIDPIKEVKKQIAGTSKALKQLPSYKGEVYRGLKFKPDKYQDFLDTINTYKQGNIVTEKAFISSTTDLGQAMKFADGVPGDFIIDIGIQSKNGKAIWKLSSHANEMEVLFDKDTQFIVKKVEKFDDNSYSILLEEV